MYAQWRVRSEAIDIQRGIEADKEALAYGKTEEEIAAQSIRTETAFAGFRAKTGRSVWGNGGSISHVIEEQSFHWE